jgi:hydrogenase expression/formation protein HypC
MCLGTPGQLIEWTNREHGIASADVEGTRRDVNVQLLQEGPDAVDLGDWVLIHLGFAMAKIDEEEAAATSEFLARLGEPDGVAFPALEEDDG